MKRRYKVLIVASIIISALLIAPYPIPPTRAPEAPTASLVSASGRFLQIDGADVYVEEQGPVGGEAVVLIHGLGGSTFSWRENAPFLASEGYRVIALDLRGFGLSSRGWGTGYSHRAQAALVARVLEVLGIQRAYFVGHSMGASVMFHFARLYPKKVLGLVSVDGALNLEAGSPLPSLLLRFPPLRRWAGVILTRYVIRDRFASILASAYYRKDVLTDEVIEGYYNRVVRNMWERSLLAMTRDFPQNVIDFPLAGIEARTLVIRGEEDTWVSQADTDHWKGQLPNAAFQAVPGTGHLPMEEEPDVFNRMLLGFLRAG